MSARAYDACPCGNQKLLNSALCAICARLRHPRRSSAAVDRSAEAAACFRRLLLTLKPRTWTYELAGARRAAKGGI